MDSKLTCPELANNIMAKVSEKLPPELAEKALIAIGVEPHSEEAKEWLGFKTFPDEICIVAYSYCGKIYKDLTSVEHEKALAKMVLAKAEYYRTYHLAVFEGKIQHSAISYEGYGKGTDCAVRYMIKEHDINKECGFGGGHVLDIYVYVETGVAEESRKAVWSVEPLIIEWADQSGKMWTSSHKPLF